MTQVATPPPKPSSGIAIAAMILGFFIVAGVVWIFWQAYQTTLNHYGPPLDANGQPQPLTASDVATGLATTMAALTAPIATTIGLFATIIAAIYAIQGKATAEAEAKDAKETASQGKSAAQALETVDAGNLSAIRDIRERFPRAFGA